MKCLLCAKYFIYINSLNSHHNTMIEFPLDRWRNWGSMGFYKVVNSGNRIKIQVCLTLHYSLHLPQGSLVSMSSFRAQGQGGRASCRQAKGGHICLNTQRQPSWVCAASKTGVLSVWPHTVQNQGGLYEK